jgi:hypothetical protein
MELELERQRKAVNDIERMRLEAARKLAKEARNINA